jgi:uncharacterized protein (DUF1499 family)
MAKRSILVQTGLAMLVPWWFLAGPLAAGPVQMQPCPSWPNCVSSLAEDARHRIDPFPVVGSAEMSLARLAKIVEAFARTRIVHRDPLYLKAEFRTRLGFVDDVEFLVDAARQTVHVRSASRSGYWDLGVNRRRIEALRKHYLTVEAGR